MVFIFDIEQVNTTVVSATPDAPTVLSSPASTASGALTPEREYGDLSAASSWCSPSSAAPAPIVGQPQSGQALGAGFVVDDKGYILTNAHVVDESGRQADSVTVVFDEGGSETRRTGWPASWSAWTSAATWR